MVFLAAISALYDSIFQCNLKALSCDGNITSILPFYFLWILYVDFPNLRTFSLAMDFLVSFQLK